MHATKLAKLAKWCERQSRLLAADWECRSRAGKPLPGAPALPGIRDELVRRLAEAEPALAAAVESLPAFSRSDWAAARLARWAESLATMASAVAEADHPAEAQPTAAATSVNAMIIDLLCRRPDSGAWSARRIATALGCGKSTVANSDAFKKLGAARELARLDRAEKAQVANQYRGRR
jgi:hypothetical protein